MMFERFTKRARTAVKAAQRIAAESGAESVGPEHLMLAMLEDDESLAVRVMSAQGAPPEEVRSRLERRSAPDAGLDEDDASALEVIGIDLAEVTRRVEENLGGSLAPAPGRKGNPRFSKTARKALELSLREALALKHNYIGTEHILLGLARGGDPAVTAALTDLGLGHSELRRAIVEALRQAG